MSNIVLKGDVIQDLGEYLPNPYIESIEVRSAPAGSSTLISLDIFYSIMFLISDDYNIDDIQEQITDVNFFCCLRDDDVVISKKELLSKIYYRGATVFSAVRELALGSEVSSLLNDSTKYQDDLYDEQGRRILKVTSSKQIQFATQNSDFSIYFYAFSSLMTKEDFSLMASNHSRYLNTGNIAYEKVFSPGFNVLREEEVIYVGRQDEKYGQVPILGLNRNFYKTETVSREDIISKVNALVRRFEGRSIGPLSDSVNSIKTVLAKEANTENLLVQLDKVRRSFPNKTNNNPVGNLYAALAVLLRNINSAFRPADIVKKEKYLTGKVLDLRTNPVAAYEAPVTFSLEQYIPEDMFFLHRERLSEDETSDLAINRGMFFIRYEEMLKRESNISALLNVDKLYQTVAGLDLQNLKRILFSYFRPTLIKVKKSDPNEETFGGFMSAYSLDGNTGRDNRETSFILPNLNPQSQAASINESSELYSERFKEYNFGFDNPSERMLCYSFVDADSFSAVYEENQEGGIVFDYKISATIYDDTQEFVIYLINKFDEINTLLQDYKDFANEICSYNNIDNRFNDFFVESIRDKYPVGVYPWEVAPSIYSVMAYVLTEQFPTFEDVIRYSKDKSATINPENGNLDSLTDFANTMTSLRDNQINNLGDELQRFIRAPPTTTYELEKTFQVKPFNYRKLLSEADAEFESLFRNKMLYYNQQDVIVSPSGIPSLIDGSTGYSPTSKTKAQFMVLLLDAIEQFFVNYQELSSLDKDMSYDFTVAQQQIRGSLIQSFINNLQILFRAKRNQILKEEGFRMFKFGGIGGRTIDDSNVQTAALVFLGDVGNLYEEANPAGTIVEFSSVSNDLNKIANLIYNYYNSPRVDGGKLNLQYDITVGDFATTPVESQIKNEIVINFDPTLPVSVGSYTGPDINEIAGYEDISF